jgi:hypothetical protein
MIRLAIAALVSLGAAGSLPVAARDEPRVRNPSFGAIAYHPESGSIGWVADRRTSREAKIEALRQCSHEKCEVVASVTRGCAALARNTKKHAVQKGVTRQEAETKALRRCGAQCEIAAWTCTR